MNFMKVTKYLVYNPKLYFLFSNCHLKFTEWKIMDSERNN
jgi:hypothetical protein